MAAVHALATQSLVSHLVSLTMPTHADRYTSTIVAALLHDVIDDTSVDQAAIEAEFGAEVADMVGKVSKLSQMNQLWRRRRRKVGGGRDGMWWWWMVGVRRPGGGRREGVRRQRTGSLDDYRKGLGKPPSVRDHGHHTAIMELLEGDVFFDLLV